MSPQTSQVPETGVGSASSSDLWTLAGMKASGGFSSSEHGALLPPAGDLAVELLLWDGVSNFIMTSFMFFYIWILQRFSVSEPCWFCLIRCFQLLHGERTQQVEEQMDVLPTVLTQKNELQDSQGRAETFRGRRAQS